VEAMIAVANEAAFGATRYDVLMIACIRSPFLVSWMEFSSTRFSDLL
jgi:hypothetical protein